MSTASAAFFNDEDRQRFNALHEQYIQTIKPVNIVEADMVYEMVESLYQERRCCALENCIIQLQTQALNPGKFNVDLENLDAFERQALAFLELAEESKALQHLSRYRAEHNRRFHRSMRLLMTIRAKGFFEKTETRNEPSDAAKSNTQNQQSEPPKICRTTSAHLYAMNEPKSGPIELRNPLPRPAETENPNAFAQSA